jgi:hypothetical protein
VTESQKKTPAKRSARKPRAKKPAPKVDADAKKAEDNKRPEMVAPLNREAFQMVMSIIQNANIKGADVENVIQLKMELMRVAGVRG